MSDCTGTLLKKKIIHLIYQEGHALRDKFLGGASHLLISQVLPIFILNAQAGILPNRQALTGLPGPSAAASQPVPRWVPARRRPGQRTVNQERLTLPQQKGLQRF